MQKELRIIVTILAIVQMDVSLIQNYTCIFDENNPTDWDLEDVNYESNRDKDKT